MWWRGGEDDGNVLKFDQEDDVDGLVLVIIIILIDQRKRRVRRQLALVEVVCERPEICADLLNP